MFLYAEDIRKAGVKRTNGGLYIKGAKVEDTGITKRANRFHKHENHRT